MTRILYIENEESFGSGKIEAFERGGYEVIPAASVAEAKDKFAEILPDIIVTDYNLGKETGVDFVKWLRQQEQGKTLPVLMLSNRYIEDIKKENNDFETLGIVCMLKSESHFRHEFEMKSMLRATQPSISSLEGSINPS